MWRFLGLACVSMVFLASFGGAAFAEAKDEQAPAEIWEADGAAGTFQHEFARRLYHDSLPSARDFAKARVADEGQIAEFAYGVALFFGAVEGLVADLSRHGLLNHEELDIPFLRLPTPSNQMPESIDYAGFRKILQDFIDRLAGAEAPLGRVDDPHIQLPIRPALVRLDLDGDGVYAVEERAMPIFRTILFGPRRAQDDWAALVALLRRFENPAERAHASVVDEIKRRAPAVGADGADAAWTQGYGHLLSAMVEILLAHDWEASFNQSFHLFFPQSDLPYAVLNETYRRPPNMNPHVYVPDHDIALALDVISFAVHSPWRPTEPQRLRAARGHLKSMIAASRKSWGMILNETDNLDAASATPGYVEWIPGPAQLAAENRGVTQNVLDGWVMFLDEFEKMLDGDLLIPHRRFAQGMNIRRMFEEPRPISPILLAQGADALPYLEDGPVADSAYMDEVLRLLGGDFLTHFFWFN